MCLSEVPELMHIAQHEDVFMLLLFLLQKVTSPQAQEQGTNKRTSSQRCLLLSSVLCPRDPLSIVFLVFLLLFALLAYN